MSLSLYFFMNLYLYRGSKLLSSSVVPMINMLLLLSLNDMNNSGKIDALATYMLLWKVVKLH